MDDLIDRRVRRRYTPVQIAQWLEHLALRVEEALAEIEPNIGSTPPPRLRATLNDLRMLAALARYHHQKTFAAIRLALWQHTRSTLELRLSRSRMIAAREHWQALAALGTAYDEDLCFQLGSPDTNARRGHWRDRLAEMDRDLDRLDNLIAGETDGGGAEPIPLIAASQTLGLHTMVLHAPERWHAGETLPVRLSVPDGFSGGVRLHYRHTNLLEGDFNQVSMERQGSTYRTDVPGDYLTPEWDLLLYVSIPLSQTAVQIIPGLWHPEHPMPYRVINIKAR